MKILKSSLFKRGGAEKYALRTAIALRDRGTEVTLLTSGPIEAVEGVEILSYEPKGKTSVQRVREFDHFCQTHQGSSNVFGFDRNSFQTHMRASNGAHAAYLSHRAQEESLFKRASFTINPLHRLLLKLEKIGFEHPDLQCLITNSHMVKKEILSHYSTDPKKIHVVHNGVEWHEFAAPFESWNESTQFRFLFIGHNFRRKGLERILKALPLLQNQDFHLDIVGHDKDIASFRSSEKVTFHGPQTDILSFYQAADALVIPSYYDPFANVTVEALAMGLHVVTSKTNGGHEVLTEESGTIIEDLHSLDSVASALSRAMTYPKTRNRATSVRESVRHLDFSNQLGKLLELCT